MEYTQAPLFRSPLSKGYWRAAAQEWKSVKILALAALLIALRVVISKFFIPLPIAGSTQRIYFTFFINALGSYLYGPLMALAAGGVADLVSFVIAPTGGFFFGYTLTAMAGSLIYALFFYRARITVVRIVLCKLVVNLLVNVGMNGLWDSMLMGKGYLALMAVRIPKNLITLPLEILLLVLFFNLMLPIVEQMGLAPAQPRRPIPLK